VTLSVPITPVEEMNQTIYEACAMVRETYPLDETRTKRSGPSNNEIADYFEADTMPCRGDFETDEAYDKACEAWRGYWKTFREPWPCGGGNV